MAKAEKDSPLFEYVLRLGDNALINGQRLSEWCGHGPFLEEDVGVANTALDLIGRARMLLSYAGQVEGRGRDEDDLAYGRDEREWRNFLIMELPNGDFGFTTARQFLVDVHDRLLYAALKSSSDETLAAIAAKAHKESEYHLRHTSEWMLRLGDGTEESHQRIQSALDQVWAFADEMFQGDEVDAWALAGEVGPDPAELREQWAAQVRSLLKRAGLKLPEDARAPGGGRRGLHTEHMGYLLAEMQFVQRAYPGLTW